MEANSREEALSWGREVAESFTRVLFQAAGWDDDQEIPSWKESGFACWIEDDPETALSSDILKAIPEVRVGEMPLFSEGKIL